VRGAVALLEEHDVDFEFRDYVKSPLSQAELRELLAKLGTPARDLLRRNDKAYRAHGLSGDESDTELVPLIAKHPGLLQRPIAVKGARALVARPPELVLSL
jgi:arsenate reductase